MQFWQGKRNANGNLPSGASSALSTKGDNDDLLSALPVGAGGIGAVFKIPAPPVSGLAYDFDADNIAGTDGATPTKWIDASGNNAIAIAVGSPTLKTGSNGINGHNVVRFADAAPGTAETCCFTVPANVTGWAGMSVYYVARSGAGGSSTRWGGVFGWPQETGSWLNCALGSATDGQGAGWAGATGGVGFGNVSGYAPHTTFYASYRYDKANWTIDGIESATRADTAWPTSTFNAIIGSNSYPFSQSDNDVARILVYNRRLTDAEDAQVKAYLEYAYAQGAAPGRQFSVGYPETLTNFWTRRYVHPAGSDDNDGKTEQTAKATVLAAWDSAVEEIGGSGQIELFIHDLSYMGGEVENNGLWLYHFGSAPGPGWRAYHPHRIIGIGGPSAGRGFTPCKARVYQGHPGDSQAFDKTKPLIWITGGGLESTVENIQPVLYGFARLGVQALSGNASGTRDGNLENLWWSNVLMASPPDTDPVFGPCFDCGWISLCWFRFCQAAGSAAMRSVAINSATDNAAGTTITLVNGAFDSATDIGGYLIILGGPNQGQWFIDAVLSPTSVTVHGSHPLVAAYFGLETIEKAFGPAVLDDDDHAGVLLRPTDADAGDPGSMGEVQFDWFSTQQCGIKAYLGSQGELGLFIHGFVSEGGPMPHPVQVRLMPGATVPALNSSNTQLVIDRRFLVADGFGLDQYYLYIDESLHDRFGVGTIKVGDMQGGAVFGPCIWSGNDAVEQSLDTTPTRMRQYGWFKNGKLTGKHDAAVRLGLPGTALPSSTGSTGNNVTNLLSHDPSTWTGPATHYTGGVADVFGLSNGGKIDALSSGAMTIPQSSVAPASTTVSAGDFFVVGVWMRAADGPNVTLCSVIASSVGGSTPPGLPNVELNPTWRGNAEWEFFRAYAVVTTGGTGAFSLNIPATAQSALIAAYPVLRILRVSDGYTEEEAAAAADTLHTWNPLLAQGSAGTLRGQPFVASGGLGVAPSVLVTPSGTATQAGNLPICGADGRTVIAWVPTVGSNKSLLASGGVTSVGATAPATSSGGAFPVIGLNYNTSNFHVNGFNELERLALTGDATASAGSNVVTVPTKGKVLIDGSDTTADYLASKIESTSGNIAVTTIIGSGNEKLNLNALQEDQLDFFVSIPSLQPVNTANQQVATASTTPFSSGTTTNPIEYPCKFIATHVYLDINIIASIGTAASMDVWVTLNGTAITGTDINFTPGTTGLGVISVGPIVTGSSSSTDRYGLQQVYNGTFGGGPFGAQIAYTARIRLTEA